MIKKKNQETNFNFNYMENSQEVNQEFTNEESEKMSNDIQESQKEFKFVFVGGNEPMINEAFVKSLNEYGQPITVYELTNPEMRFIVNSRAEKQAEVIAVEYIKDQKNIDRANDFVNRLITNFLNFTYKGERLKEKLDSHLEGDLIITFTQKELKLASGMSWKEFNELFATLELFGLVRHNENSTFSLLSTQNDIFENKLNELKEMFRLSVGKVTVLRNLKSTKSKEKKKLDSIINKLSGIIEKM